MKNVRLLRISVSVLIALIAFGASLTATGAVRASNIRKYQHVNDQQFITAIPRWKDARKISTEHGVLSPASFGPPCLFNSQPGIAESQCYSPQQLRNTYEINPLLKAGVTGKGRKIVIIDASSSSTLQFDLHVYDQMFGLKDPQLNVIAPFGMPPVDLGVYTETALDVQTAHSMAPDADINLVLTGDTTNDSTAESFFYDLLKAVKYAIDQDLGDVISISYGAGENCFDNAYFQYQHAILQEARTKHISVFISSGDAGAAMLTCVSPNSPITTAAKDTNGLDDPLATMVGGTTLHASVGKGKYQSETVWNESSNDYGATGGGFSRQFPRPMYQLGVTDNNQRGEPDVSWLGDPLTGVPIVLSSGSGLNIVPAGGTSVGAPAWAALGVLFDQYAGRRLGFLNAGLYRILQSKVYYSNAFHDVTTGNNTVIGYDSHGQPYTITGYDAGQGWDPTTGVGTPKAAALAQLLAGFVHDDDGSEI